MTDKDHDGATHPSARQAETEKQKIEAWARERQRMLNRFYAELNSPEGLSEKASIWWHSQY